ncbi:hypothetical protein ID866_10242 [Astraeus odoratus]|nr:hypothetical protein ID866_10242 [Astraeus odoratus]
MAARIGACASVFLLPAQFLRVHESWPSDVRTHTGKIQLARTFMTSMIVSQWVNMGEAEAFTSGMWVHGAGQGSRAHLDDGVFETMCGSLEQGRRISNVDMTSGRKTANLFVNDIASSLVRVRLSGQVGTV